MNRAWLLGLLMTAAGPASAQLIAIKTVPLAQGDQFEIFPSHNLGMGGVSIALADTLHDPFVNPAKGAWFGAPRFVSSPNVYGISKQAGGGGTLPVAATTRLGSWFGALSFALQGIDAGPALPGPGSGGRSPPDPGGWEGNSLAFLSLGRVLPGHLSLGASGFWAGLHAIDGTDWLYAGNLGVKQSGTALDLRLGALKEWSGGQSLEAVLLHNRVAMVHDVAFPDASWDPRTQQIVVARRVETNQDETNTWGLHLAYQRPIGDAGWRIGGIATANRMFHPELPEYEVTAARIVAIPWDPGDSYAYNIGLGLARVHGAARIGFEVVYEPIWSHTWGEAEAPLATRLGDTIPAGGSTMDNHFRFSNAVIRIGVGQQLSRVTGIQLGLAVREVHYWLAQYDNVHAAGRTDEQQWAEWMPTWGLSLRFPEVEIRYQGRVTNGTGRPGAAGGGDFIQLDGIRPATAVLATPSGPLNLGDVSVVTHQVSVSVPFGRPGARGGAP